MSGWSLAWPLLGVVAFAVLTSWRITKAVRRHYRHHRRANKRFMAGYRAGYRAAQSRRRQA